jgi:hypothetical protein
MSLFIFFDLFQGNQKNDNGAGKISSRMARFSDIKQKHSVMTSKGILKGKY